jgi:cobalt-zinc-cadmium efflux system outer membrane protein
MAAAYPQVLVAQRTLFTTSQEYLESLDRLWRSASRLQGLLAGDGLATAGD